MVPRPGRVCSLLVIAALSASGCAGQGDGGADTGAVTTTIGSSASTATGATASTTMTTGESDDTAATSNDTADTNAEAPTDGSGDGDGDASGDGDGDSSSAGDGDGMQEFPPRDSLMNAFLDDALARAAAIDSGLQLTQINGFGIDATGRVGIDGDTGFVRRWNFGFHDPGDAHEVSIIYMSETWAGDYPQVEDPAGNVTATDPILGPGALPDSDVIVGQYQAAIGCAALSGFESDSMLIRYEASRGGNVVQFTVGGSSWGADLPSFVEWYGC